MTVRPFLCQPQPKPQAELAAAYRKHDRWYRERNVRMYRDWMAGASKEYIYWTYKIEWARALRCMRECEAYEQLHGVLD